MVSLSRLAMSQAVERQTRLSREIADLETAIATGKQLLRPSEAPDQWAALSDVSRRRSDLAAARPPIATGLARAAEADRWLGALTENLTRARELTVLAGGTPGVSRAALVAELTAMRDDLPTRLAQVSASGTPLLDQGSPLEISLGDGRVTAVVPQLDDVRLLPGGTPISDVFDAAITAAGSGDPADLAAALSALDAATQHIAAQQARQGIRMQRLEEAEVLISDADADLAAQGSALGDTDIAAAITLIQTLAVQRDAARAMLGRTTAQTLFDYLR